MLFRTRWACSFHACNARVACWSPGFSRWARSTHSPLDERSAAHLTYKTNTPSKTNCRKLRLSLKGETAEDHGPRPAATMTVTSETRTQWICPRNSKKAIPRVCGTERERWWALLAFERSCVRVVLRLRVVEPLKDLEPEMGAAGRGGAGLGGAGPSGNSPLAVNTGNETQRTNSDGAGTSKNAS